MADYKTMYTKLFNVISDTIGNLQAAQIETEEMFMSQEEPEIVLLNQPGDE